MTASDYAVVSKHRTLLPWTNHSKHPEDNWESCTVPLWFFRSVLAYDGGWLPEAVSQQPRCTRMQAILTEQHVTDPACPFAKRTKKKSGPI